MLLVDDNEAARVLVARYLGRSGFDGHIQHAESIAEACASLEAGPFDVVVTDHFFRGKAEGLNLVRHIRATRPTMPVVVFSSADQLCNAAMQAGATAFVSTRHWDQIATCVRNLLHPRQNPESPG